MKNDNKQLAVIVKESGLSPSNAEKILEIFTGYFEMAGEWEQKAKNIIVTSPTQTDDMALARAGRLFLREKRIAVESTRKELKEQSLREGRAIDGIANVLKALIVPIEDYLEQQERFVQIQEEKKDAELRAEIERRMEAERLAQEKADAEERERLRVENEKLKKEAEERERKSAEERKKQGEKLFAEKAKLKAAQEKADEARREQESKLKDEREKARKERESQEAILAKERDRAADAKRKAEESSRKKLEAEREERQRLEEMLKCQATCPKCGHKFDPQAKNA